MSVPMLQESRSRVPLREPRETPRIARVIPLPLERERPAPSLDEAIRSGTAEDQRLSRSAIAWTFLGIPIGILVVTAFVAVILAVQGSLGWPALLAGAFGGTVAGAYFGGVAGLAHALNTEPTTTG